MTLGYWTVVLSSLATSVLGSAPSGPWDAFNFAPPSRTVYPRYVRQTGGNVSDATSLLLTEGSATLSGNGSYVTLDFGYEVSVLLSRSLAWLWLLLRSCSWIEGRRMGIAELRQRLRGLSYITRVH